MRELMVSELRQRLRGKRWWLVLGIWLAVLLGLLALTRAAASGVPDLLVGPFMFGSLALFVLLLACLIVPSLTSGAINGERQGGTLAVLQATLLRPWEIVAAKLGAAILTAGAFLLATVPLAIWCVAEGDVGIGAVFVTYLLLIVTCAVLAALGLAASALVRRVALSAVLAYGVVFALTVGTPIVFGLSFIGASGDDVGWRWLLLAPNPVVVLADAAPSPAAESAADVGDPLSAIKFAGRLTRRTGFEQGDDAPPLWPTGLAVLLLLAAAAAALTLDRLRVPARRLGAGERVA